MLVLFSTKSGPWRSRQPRIVELRQLRFRRVAEDARKCTATPSSVANHLADRRPVASQLYDRDTEAQSCFSAGGTRVCVIKLLPVGLARRQMPAGCCRQIPLQRVQDAEPRAVATAAALALLLFSLAPLLHESNAFFYLAECLHTNAHAAEARARNPALRLCTVNRAIRAGRSLAQPRAAILRNRKRELLGRD